MRTTVNISDHILVIIKGYAEVRGVSLGQAASDLVQRGAESLPAFKTRNGFALLETPAPLTTETVAAYQQSEYEEEYQRAFAARR